MNFMGSTQEQIPPKTEMIDTSSRQRPHATQNPSSKEEETLGLDSDEEVKGTEVNGLNQTVKDKRRKDTIQQSSAGRFTIAGTVSLPQNNFCDSSEVLLTLNIEIDGRFLIDKGIQEALGGILFPCLGKRRRGRPAIG